jgi:hypothetical protein
MYRLPPWPPLERSEPPATDVNPDHLVLGLAASLGAWQPHQFTRFLAWHDSGRDGEPALPLRLNHEPAWITSHGAEPAAMGECLAFRSVPAGDSFPGGLLVLAVLYPEWAPPVLGGMRGEWKAMSVGGAEHAAPGEAGDLWLAEVSLVSKIGEQADEDALVIRTGRGAVTAWELLTGEAAFPA